MKTTDTIQRQIAKLQNDALLEVNPKARKKMAKELTFLTNCRNYLEHSPGEEFLKETLAKLEKQISGLHSNFNVWVNATPSARALKNPKTAYATAMGLNSLEEQAETLKFLLT